MKVINLTILSVLLIPFAVINSQGIYGFNSACSEKTTETNTSAILVKTSEKIYINDGENLIRREVEQEQSISMMNQTIKSRSISITDKEYIIT